MAEKDNKKQYEQLSFIPLILHRSWKTESLSATRNLSAIFYLKDTVAAGFGSVE